LQKALVKENHPKGLILQSDQGGQYSWWEFTMFCNNHGLRQSMSKAGVLMTMLLWRDITILLRTAFII
jgi:hypothetical protein